MFANFLIGLREGREAPLIVMTLSIWTVRSSGPKAPASVAESPVCSGTDG